MSAAVSWTNNAGQKQRMDRKAALEVSARYLTTARERLVDLPHFEYIELRNTIFLEVAALAAISQAASALADSFDRVT